MIVIKANSYHRERKQRKEVITAKSAGINLHLGIIYVHIAVKMTTLSLVRLLSKIYYTKCD